MRDLLMLDLSFLDMIFIKWKKSYLSDSDKRKSRRTAEIITEDGKRENMKKHLKLCVISSIFFALLVYLIWGNTALTVSNIKISSSRIPIAFSGFRIAQVSDLHNAEFGKGNRKLLELLSESKPNIIAITGDLVDAGHTDIGVALDFAKEAVKIAPAYYVQETMKQAFHSIVNSKQDLKPLA